MNVGEEEMIEAAHALFKQRGIRSTRMEHVARACGTSLWDINLKFKSKKELVLAIIRHNVNKKTAYLLISSSLSPSAVTELNTFFRFVDETIEALGAGVLTEMKRYQPLAIDQIKYIVDDTLIPWLEKNLQRGLSEGFYRAELDSELYSSTYFYIIRTVIESERDWFQTKKAVAHINEIFLHGVLNMKGMRV